MLNTCFSHCSVLSMFPFLFNQSQLKAGAVYGCSFVAKLSWKKNNFFEKIGFLQNIHYLQKKCFYMEKMFYIEKLFTEKKHFLQRKI